MEPLRHAGLGHIPLRTLEGSSPLSRSCRELLSKPLIRRRAATWRLSAGHHLDRPVAARVWMGFPKFQLPNWYFRTRCVIHSVWGGECPTIWDLLWQAVTQILRSLRMLSRCEFSKDSCSTQSRTWTKGQDDNGNNLIDERQKPR